MKLKRKYNKGFTLVELIVVIAIVAILAAVSVVSYIAFINSANESADIQLVKQLNTCLQADEIMHGTRSTPHEMEQMLEDNGFILENLTKTKTGYDIVWDEATNRCVLLKDRVEFYSEKHFELSTKTWFFVDTKEEAESITKLGNSVYLTREVGELTTLNIVCGLDTGVNKVGTINYNERTNAQNITIAQDITIRTNSEETVLNVNGKGGADGDTVKHYGVAANVYENSCGTHSYDEYGYVVGYIFSADGHVHVIQKSDSNISASAVVITSKTVSVDVEDETPVVYSEDLEISDITEIQGHINAKNNTYDSEHPAETPQYDPEQLEQNTGGLGTEVSPYVIATSEKLQEALNNKEDKWYRLFKDITIDIQDFTVNNFGFTDYFIGHFDGKGYNIIITNTRGKAMNDSNNVHHIINKAAGYLTNFNIINETGNNVSIVNGDPDSVTEQRPLSTLEFKNINYGYNGVDKTLVIGVKNTGLFTLKTVGNYSFYNCKNYYDIESTTGDYSGIFVGGRVSNANANGINLTFDSCENYGDVIAIGSFGILVGNRNGSRNPDNTHISNCINWGEVSSFVNAGFVNQPNSSDNADDLFVGDDVLINNGHFIKLNDDGSTLSFEGKNVFVIKGSEADNFKFSLYETFKVKDSAAPDQNNQATGITMSVNIQETVLLEDLSFDVNNKAQVFFQRTSYIGYNLWKQNYNSNHEYSGSWKLSLEGLRYFYYYHESSDRGMWVIDMAERYAELAAENNFPDTYFLEEYDLSTNAIIKMVAYKGNTPVAVHSIDTYGVIR